MTDYFIADTHFAHKNILKYSKEYRPFTSLKEHDDTIIDNCNSVVTNDDRLFILGDFDLGGKKEKHSRIKNILERLHGEKILIPGNHDLDLSAETWKKLGFNKVLPMMEYNGCLLSHIPVDPGEMIGQSFRGRFLLNIHGHLHNFGNTEELLKTKRYCVSIECLDNLTPISWEKLWDDIISMGIYRPLATANKCISRRQNTIDVKVFDDKLKRIPGELFEIKNKNVYDFKYIDNDHLRINNKIIKSKYFVGVS